MTPILDTLMTEALSTPETSILTRATRRNIPEDTILHSHLRENLKSYIMFCCFAATYSLSLLPFFLFSFFLPSIASSATLTMLAVWHSAER
jgi:hypothetical protein